MKRFNKRRIATSGQTVPGLPFMGEVMTCTVCGKQEKSSPLVQSGWTRVDMDKQKFYYCPPCWNKKMQSFYPA